jgi:hypothetical protein
MATKSTKSTATKPAATPEAPKPTEKKLQIKAPNFQRIEFRLVGTAPLVTNRFANKGAIMAKQAEGSTGNKGKVREAKDFEACFENAKHKHKSGWCGVHAGGFRQAMISACRTVGFKMTLAKLGLFVKADGVDQDGNPIVRINGTPRMVTHPVRNDSGVIDIRARPMWDEWFIDLVVEYDADIFTQEDVANLLMRVGRQVGIGEGRPDSKDSAGMGWGTFSIGEHEHERAAAE